MRSIVLLLAALSCLSFRASEAESGAPDPNNILVSLQLYNFNGGSVQNHVVREFTPGGSLVQTIPFPASNASLSGFQWLRDITVDQFGSIDAFDGTFNPYLARYSPASATFTHQAFPGWSILNNTTWGGIAAFRQYIYATDSWTYYGRPSGIIRFDVVSHSAVRFADGNDFSDLNIGVDGKLYALNASSSSGGGTGISVFDPVTMDLLARFPLPSDLAFTDSIRALAADQNGHIFLVGQRGFVYVVNRDGVLEASQTTGFFNLMDIDVDQAGQIIIGQEEGYVLLGHTDLTTPFSSFLAYADPNVLVDAAWVSFAHPVPLPDGAVPTPVPTPTATPTPTPTHTILVSFGHGSGTADAGFNGVREFSFDGTLLRTIRFDYNGGVYPDTEYLRDIVVDQDGAINGFNGTFNPFVSRYWPVSQTLTHTTFPGWNIYNVRDCGGIAAYQNFIYAGDMDTSGQINLNGIIRFDTSANSATRFAAGTDFIDINMGLDGKLYGLFSAAHGDNIATDINIYHPVTMDLLGHLSLPPDLVREDDIRSIAVDKDGQIFVCGLGGTVYRLSSDGQVEVAGATGFNILSDIDVDEAGKLIIAQEDGWVITSDSNLADFACFNVFDGYVGSHMGVFVAFTPSVTISQPPPAPTPHPTASPTPTPTPTASLTPAPVLPVINISVSPKQIRKGQDATFTISLSAPSLQPVPFDWANGGRASPGTDYTINGTDPAYLPRTMIIPAGQTSATITLHAVLDAVAEKSESVEIQLGLRPEYRLHSKHNTAKLKILKAR